MNRRPWMGLGLSLAVHAAVLALLVAAVWRGESLPALMVDLREGFAPAVASIRTRVSEVRHGRRSASPQPAPQVGQPMGEAPASAPPPTASSLSTPSPIAPSPPSPPSAPGPPPSLPTLPRAPSNPGVVASREPSLPTFSMDAPVEPAPQGVAGAAPTGSRAVVGGANASGVAAERRSHGGVTVVAAGGGDGASAASNGGVGSSGAVPAVPADAAGRREGAGAPSPAVGLAAAGSGVGLGAEYGPYLTSLRQRIQQSLRYPTSARRRGVSGTVNVEILILANGTIGDVTLLDSSTHSVLDDAALDTIRSLPRMPLPPELPARTLRVRVPVVFQMR